MNTPRQLAAVASLVHRQWTRQSPLVRVGQKRETKAGYSALLLRLVGVVFLASTGFLMAGRVNDARDPIAATEWLAFALALVISMIAFAVELPSPRRPISALVSPLLEMLPLTRAARLLINLAQVLLVVPLVLTAAWAVMPTSRSLAMALVWSVTATLWGLAAGKLVRRALPAYWAARFSWVSGVAPILVIPLVVRAPGLGEIGVHAPFGSAFAGALFRDDAALHFVFVVVSAAVAWAVWVIVDRQSVDQALPLKAAAVTASASARGGSVQVERLLHSREPGGRVALPFMSLILAALTCGVLWLSANSRRGVSLWLGLLLFLGAQLAVQFGSQRALRSVARDVLARPLLGALPIAPNQTIAAKVSVLRRDLLLMIAPLALLLWHGIRQPAELGIIVWRLGVLVAAVLVFSHGAVAVAFLTQGLGQVRGRSGASGSLESILLLFPFFGAVLSTNPVGAILSLGCLAALTLEARRAAARVVDWLDDPAAEHGTELWRALVVFGAFQTVQLLVMQLLMLFDERLSDAQRVGIVAVVGGLALYLATINRQAATALAFAPGRAAWGLLGGAAAAVVGFGYARAVTAFGWGSPTIGMTTVLDRVALSLAIVGVAPLVEERFFRGWLLPEIEAAVGKRGFAVLLCALAFAAVHPPISFLPVFVLGLVTSVLAVRVRSLTACIVAHAVYNALALLF
jgi:membrane protease YdiL (CAAX protease family)